MKNFILGMKKIFRVQKKLSNYNGQKKTFGNPKPPPPHVLCKRGIEVWKLVV